MMPFGYFRVFRSSELRFLGSKTGENKREGEQTVALKLYAETNLEGATITGDALNNNVPQAHAITQAGGHYFLQLKNENHWVRDFYSVTDNTR